MDSQTPATRARRVQKEGDWRGGGSRFLGEKEQAGKVCRKVGNLREKEKEGRGVEEMAGPA